MILFKLFMALQIYFYRLTGGKLGGRMAGIPVLLLTTTGRKSGKEHTTPLGCFESDGGYVIIASNGGAKSSPGWFYNLKSSPHATIEIGDQVLEVDAEIAGPDKRPRLWTRLIELSPGYANYQKRTTHEIPVVILHPAKA
jgi:F420H(2)-dependent quinone reductase